jgi:peptidyl-prolyl cis-trans isomerase A (cyclophilin A)
MPFMRIRIAFLVILAFAAAALCYGAQEAGRLPELVAQAPPPVPDVYRVNFETSKGSFVIEVIKAWAPLGAERFYRLVQQKFYDNQRFFRVIRGFMVQLGLSGTPAVAARWSTRPIKDDKVTKSNTRGMVTYAMAGPNTRTTQIFINYANNSALDKDGFAPFGHVVGGMEVVDGLYSGYGDGPPEGRGPDQGMIQTQGNSYLESKFPRLDYIKTARIVQGENK